MAITNSALPITLRLLSDSWPETMVDADFVPQASAIQAITEQQTAQLSFANLPDQADAVITWLNNCDITVDACASECDFSGQEADSYRQTVEIDQCAESKFSVKIDEWRGNAFGEAQATAVNLLKVQKGHAEHIAKHIISTLNSNAGQNTYTDQGFWDVTTPTNSEHASAATPTIFGNLRRLASRNNFFNPFVLTGGHLDQMIWEASTAASNDNGRGDARRIAEMPVYTDIVNVEAINTTTYSSYLMSRGATALVSRGYFTPTIQILGGDTQRFSVTNRYFPNIVHDVTVVQKCASPGVWSNHYKVQTRYKLFINPTGCTATTTGILRVSKA